MQNWTIIFLAAAVAAAVLGFGVWAGAAASIAQLCFVIFLALFLVRLVTGGRRRLL